MTHKRWLLLIGLLVVASLALAACAPAATEEAPAEEEAPPPAEEEEVEVAECVSASDATKVEVCPGERIRIGASIGLTGPLPDPGADIKNGVEIAVSDLNEADGILGFEVEADIEDGACDGDAGTNVGNLFAADPTIVAVSGGMCTGETMGLRPILQEARIPFITPSSTNPIVTDTECDVCNRAVLSDKFQANVDAAYFFNELGVTKMALMHDNGDYGLGLAELMQASFEALGGEVVAFEGITVGDTDFRAVLTQVAATEPELLFFGGYATEAGLIAAQMKETGMADVVFSSGDGSKTDQYLEAAGPAAEGSYISAPVGDEAADLNVEFDAKYEERYGVTPDTLGPYHANAYDTVMVIANAIEQVGVVDDSGKLTVNREDLIQAVRGTADLQGLTGTLTCNEIGDCGAGGIQIFKVESGEFVQVSGFGME